MRFALLVLAASCRSSPAPPPVDAAPSAMPSAPIVVVAVADASLPPADAAPPPAEAGNGTTIAKTFGPFTVQVPPRFFSKIVAHGTELTLTSDVFEDYMDKRFTFSMTLKVVPSAYAELRTLLGPTMVPTIFPGGTEKSFKADPGFVDPTALHGAKGYVMNTGVEGIGEIRTLLDAPVGSARIDCHFCCGLIADPKMSRDEQTAICDRVLQSLTW